MFEALVVRDVKLRYKQTVFGVAWAVLQPLAAFAIFTVVFGRLAGLPSDGLPYAVFVYSGLLLWSYVSAAANAAAMSLVEQRDLVTRLRFPRLLAPLAGVTPPLLDMAIASALLVALLVWHGVVPSAALALLPLLVIAAVLVAMSVGVWLCALNVQYRDVRHVLPFALQVWLFASPVIYPASLADGALRVVLAMNPMTGLLDAGRWILAGGQVPPLVDLLSLVAGAVLLVGGLAYFRRVEDRFADVI